MHVVAENTSFLVEYMSSTVLYCLLIRPLALICRGFVLHEGPNLGKGGFYMGVTRSATGGAVLMNSPCQPDRCLLPDILGIQEYDLHVGH